MISELSFLEAISQYWVILTIPFVSGIIGWFTNLVAVRMLFYPVEFRGFGGWLGWQGIIPANAERVAAKVVKLITQKLINLGDLFRNFAGGDFLQHAAGAIDQTTAIVIEEISTRYAPALWSSLDEASRQQIRDAVRSEVEATAVRLLDDLAENVEDIIDLRSTVVEAIQRDRALLGRIFLCVGHKEFLFIENCGAFFGFLFGLILMFLWYLFPSWWLLPVAGFAVGYATNWVALRMIFEPKEPKKIGPFTIQGLFHKRQQEVADAFALIVADQVINADNIIATVTSGNGNMVVQGIVEKHVDALLEKHQDHPAAAMALATTGMQMADIRTELVVRVNAELPRPGGLLFVFADKAVDIRDMLFSRMSVLDAHSFEGLLRPAFQHDEWKLIVAGGLLGFLAGWAQVVFVFAEMLAHMAG